MLRPLLICLALLACGLNSHGGVASYTDRGTVDFDKVLPLLNPYGTWSKIDGKWAYTPLNHGTPYTDGRWLYTEFGWYWKGNQPTSWLTEHYGFWKRSEDKVWSWYPGTTWLAEIVEFRMTPTHIGWRCGEVDDNGQFVEAPEDRYNKPEEWTFVTKAQFAGPIKPGMALDSRAADEALLDATDCMHAYLTYRPIERPGPHPADFVALNKDGGMFSPYQHQELQTGAALEVPKYEAFVTSAITPSGSTTASTNAAGAIAPSGSATTPAPSGLASAPATTPPQTGTNSLTLAGMGADADSDIDRRQVKYWITMSLPTFWTPRPAEAKPEELYIYRPDFYQDEDGVQRRVTLWFDPKAKTSLKDIFAESAARPKPDSAPTADATAQAAQPATPAVPAKPHDPFSSPLDASYHPNSHASSASSKDDSSANGPAPTGMANGK